MGVTDFPLFPLDLVLLPSELVPLHIFEERYREMVDTCLEEERGFGVIWLSDGGLKDVGCAARIEEVLERYEDGRFDILVEGTSPFRLMRRREDRAYPSGDIELLEDRPTAPTASAVEKTREAFAQLAERATGAAPENEELEECNAFELAARVDLGLAAKQSLLETRSEQARLRLLTRLFKAAMRRLDLVEKAHERAQGNGKVRYED